MKKTAKKKIIGLGRRLRKDQMADFQNIVRLLVDYDEKTGRYKHYGDPETHFMRKIVSEAAAEHVTVFIKDIGGFVYHVVARVKTEGGKLITGWIHEDGIRSERDAYHNDLAHPVHSIRCLTDLYAQSVEAVSV